MNTCPKCGATYEGAEMFCPKDGTRLGGSREETRRTRGSTIPPAMDPLIGKVIQGRYRVLSQLGEGGMGVVYIAEHVEIEKKVALKVLREDFSKRPEVVERFRQEARSASKIGHAHIVDVTDFGQLDNGGVYFVMEYLQGQSLSDIINGSPVSLEITVNIVKQIARALQAAHDLGIVHRDLKPENVFLVSREENDTFVKILDFGIAKISDRDTEGKRLTKTGMIFGTPEYMSPEQAAGRSLDHRVDVYALGCIMFEMFTGSVPFDGHTFMAILTQHMFEPVPLIEQFNPETDVPISVRDVVYKAMAKDADERYADMEALEKDLERVLADAGYIVDIPRGEQSVRLAVDGLRKRAQINREDEKETLIDWAPAGKRARGIRRWIPYIAAVAIGLLLLGGGAFYITSAGQTGDGETHGGAVVDLTQPTPKEDQTITLTQNDNETASSITEGEDQGANENDPQEISTEAEVRKKIVVVVKTIPKNGVISVEGLGQVCSSTPCRIELNEGEPVEIKARLGKRSAIQTFTPSAQNSQIVLEMKKSQRRGQRRTGKKDKVKATGQKNGPKTAKPPKKSGELKIPGIFIDN